MPRDRLIIHTDGGARGNPGPAAIGVVVGDKEYSDYLGEVTNNVAEYKAVIFALKKAKQLIGKAAAKKTEVEIRLDSQLVGKQITGEYKILEPELQPLFLELWNLKQDFGRAEFKIIPREKNRRADRLVNAELERQSAKLF